MTNNVDAGLLGAIKDNAKTAKITGWVLLIAGILAVAVPTASGLSVTIFVGALLGMAGVVQCVLAFSAGAFGRGLMIFILGALSVVAGFYLMSQPVVGLAALTIMLSAYFIAAGVVEILAAFQIKPADGWVWMLIAGVVTVLLGAMLWKQFPLSGAYAVGILFGVKMIMSGWSLIYIGNTAKDVVSDISNDIS